MKDYNRDNLRAETQLLRASWQKEFPQNTSRTEGKPTLTQLPSLFAVTSNNRCSSPGKNCIQNFEHLTRKPNSIFKILPLQKITKQNGANIREKKKEKYITATSQALPEFHMRILNVGPFEGIANFKISCNNLSVQCAVAERDTSEIWQHKQALKRQP